MISEENRKKIDEIVKRYPVKRSAIMPVLRLIQEQHGRISDEGLRYVAEVLEVPAIWVYELVTFYTMFNEKPVGKYHIKVCSSIPCSLLRSEHIISYLEEKLGIGLDETTPDGKFTLTEVECLGSCGTAPVMQINEDYYENLTEEKIDNILENLD